LGESDTSGTPPSPLKTPRPPYPDEAIAKKIEGDVFLKVIIDAEGRITVYEVLKSLPVFDKVAIEFAEKEWLFEPATKNGKPVESVAELRVTFKYR
jgi:protein TonB